MELIKNIIPQVIGSMAAGKPEAQSKIQRVWQSISAGKATQHAAIVGLQQGTLIIHVDSPAWLFQLNLQKRKMLDRFKQEIPELSGIRFKIGKVK